LAGYRGSAGLLRGGCLRAQLFDDPIVDDLLYFSRGFVKVMAVAFENNEFLGLMRRGVDAVGACAWDHRILISMN